MVFKKDFQERDDEAYLSVQSLKLFHVAGEIRQLDVNLKLLKKFNFIDPDALASQHKLRAGLLLKLLSFYKKHEKKISKSNHKIAIDFADIDNNFIVLKFKTQFSKIGNNSIHKFNNPDKLHKVRKRIKQLLYMYWILPKSITTNLKINLNYLENLQHILGEWHDLFLTENFLKDDLITIMRLS
ncbi:MAG: CHAD domain-containing protein [Bacteroidetes bacterium]|nr:CHAD domain-containing protein [Bacteroidota bacterium]